MSRFNAYLEEKCLGAYSSKADNKKKKKKKKMDEATDEQKMEMYNQGAYSLRNWFSEYSQYYMKAMGMMVQNKKAINPKYKKLRDMISNAYEKMDDAISKHNNMLMKDRQKKMKKEMK